MTGPSATGQPTPAPNEPSGPPLTTAAPATAAEIAALGAGLTVDPASGIYLSRVSRPVSMPETHDALLEIEARSFWFAHRNRVITDLLARLPPAGAFVDLGGGNGHVAQALVKAGHDVALIEPMAAGAGYARKVHALPVVVQATLEDAAFPPGSLPAVGTFDVIEHIEDDASIVRAIHDQLAPGGRYYLTVPAYRWLWSAEDVDAGHFRRYTRRRLRRVLEAAGFEIEYLSCFFQVLIPPIFLVRTLPSLLRIRRTMDINRTTNEHASEGAAGRFIRRALSREATRLARGREQRVGASLIACARKPPRK